MNNWMYREQALRKAQPIWQFLVKSMSKDILNHRQYNEFFDDKELPRKRGLVNIEEGTPIDTKLYIKVYKS